MPDRQVTIRPYTSKDRQVLETLAIEVQEHERSLDNTRAPGKEIVTKHVDRLVKPIVSGKGFIIMAEVNQTCVGYLAAKVEQAFMNTYTSLTINDLGVTAGYRGRGIGTLLLKEAERLAKSKYNLSFLTIGVIVKNTGAHALYRRLGYENRELELLKKISK